MKWNGIQPSHGHTVIRKWEYTKIWEGTGREKRLVSYLESDELWLLERVDDVSIIENDTGKAMRSTFALRGICFRQRTTTGDDESRKKMKSKINKQTRTLRIRGNGRPTFHITVRGEECDAKRNNDRQVGCFNSHQSLMVHCYTLQLFVVVSTQHSSLVGGHVDCATAGWVEHSKGAIHRWLRFPRLHSSTDNHGSRTEILGIHYLSWGPN